MALYLFTLLDRYINLSLYRKTFVVIFTMELGLLCMKMVILINILF